MAGARHSTTSCRPSAASRVSGAACGLEAESHQLTPITHDGLGGSEGIPSPFGATQCPKLGVVEAPLPPELLLSARAGDGKGNGVSVPRAASGEGTVSPRVGTVTASADQC